MRRFGCVAFFLLTAMSLSAQVPANDSATLDASREFARQFFFLQRGDQSAIYNGREHDEYSTTIVGNAYFNSPAWQTGSVIYDNVLYENITMKYDVVRDQLVITPKASAGLSIDLTSSRVAAFSFNSYHFVRIDKNARNTAMTPGFYLQLGDGHLIGLVKTSKGIRDEMIGATAAQRFEERTKYYVSLDGEYTQIKNKDDLLQAVKGRRKEVQQFLSGSDYNFRKDPQGTLTAVAEFFNKSGF